MTSPGFLTGGTSRQDSGLLHGGPRWVVTDLALLDFTPDTHRMRVRALQTGVTLDQVQAATGFELLIHDKVDQLPPVEDAELASLRHLVGVSHEGAEEASR